MWMESTKIGAHSFLTSGVLPSRKASSVPLRGGGKSESSDSFSSSSSWIGEEGDRRVLWRERGRHAADCHSSSGVHSSGIRCGAWFYQLGLITRASARLSFPLKARAPPCQSQQHNRRAERPRKGKFDEITCIQEGQEHVLAGKFNAANVPLGVVTIPHSRPPSHVSVVHLSGDLLRLLF